ncbi:MAG: AlpA family transcriptional regulator [Gemmatimonadales bacterium]|nr:AlpA family transcriptional regulator [Gemmatimonadales bacterium]MYB05931.1 AlpA family transcriptional regulator [Gemmatimonadota bacterium]MYK00332.1 AlpA family transcriptional regulator [Candidatus Palauibacter ramosifaciens]MYG22748.1 AlpA family transcriptional regulator [Gemmatimonadota bacterium]MYG49146.1 AlpA family transcriptional regulator [Gemmatimonadales bacterium]
MRVRILRLPEVQRRTGLSRSTIYVRLDQGRFPKPVSLGARAVGWIESEVDEWIRERIAESRGDSMAASTGYGETRR